MSRTTFEQAKECPKCGKLGEVVKTEKRWSDNQGAEVTLNTIRCRTELCPWFETDWYVQVNPDGSIPQPGEQLGPKQYPKFSQETETRINEALEAQLRAETEPGSEVRNPHGY